MSTSPTLPPVLPDHQVVPKRQRRWPRQAGIAAAIIVALGIGIGIGAAANNKSSQLNAANATISQQRQKLGQLQGTVGTLQSKYETATQQLADETNTANHALASATAKVKAADAAKQAQLNGEAATLKSRQNTLNQEIGDVQANSIGSDGMYVVGRDIKSGTWHTNGDGGSGNQCYYQTDNSSDLSSISNIGSNANFDGPETVDVSGYYAFEIQGPCTWVLVG